MYFVFSKGHFCETIQVILLLTNLVNTVYRDTACMKKKSNFTTKSKDISGIFTPARRHSEIGLRCHTCLELVAAWREHEKTWDHNNIGCSLMYDTVAWTCAESRTPRHRNRRYHRCLRNELTVLQSYGFGWRVAVKRLPAMAPLTV